LAEGAELFSAAEAGVELATQAASAKGVEKTYELVRKTRSMQE
jgi:hypothetical protein